MVRTRLVFATIIAGGFLLAVGTSRAEVTCERLRVEALRCVRGTVIDEQDDVVPRADVAILKDGTVIANVETGKDGKFKFGKFKPASYDLWVTAERFRRFQVPIVVQNPATKCKQALEIVLVGGGETCMSVRLVQR
jgi:hypothetical protein